MTMSSSPNPDEPMRLLECRTRTLGPDDRICQNCVDEHKLIFPDPCFGASWETAVCRACGQYGMCAKVSAFVAVDTIVLKMDDRVFESQRAGAAPDVRAIPQAERATARYEQCRKFDEALAERTFTVASVTVHRAGRSPKPAPDRIKHFVVEFAITGSVSRVKTHIPEPPDLLKFYTWAEISSHKCWINGMPYIKPNGALTKETERP